MEAQQIEQALTHLVDPWWSLEHEWGEIANGRIPMPSMVTHDAGCLTDE